MAIHNYFQTSGISDSSKKNTETGKKFSHQYGVHISEKDCLLLQERIVVLFSCVVTDRRFNLPSGSTAKIFSDELFLGMKRRRFKYDAITALDNFPVLSKEIGKITDPIAVFEKIMEFVASTWTPSRTSKVVFNNPLTRGIRERRQIADKASHVRFIFSNSTSLLSRNYAERWLLAVKRFTTRIAPNAVTPARENILQALQSAGLMDKYDLK